MRSVVGLAGATLGLIMALSGFAPATASAGTIYTAANGTKSFPGQFVGTVGFEADDVYQIGDLSTSNGGSGGAFVNNTANPSIFSFYYGGGFLVIKERIGNNGIGDAIDVELASLASATSTSPSATLASISIPFSSGPSAVYTVFNGQLAAGYYAIDSYLALSNVIDPNYQINFSVPEPATMAVLSVGLIGLGCASRRRRNGASAA